MYFMKDEQEHVIKSELKGGVGDLDFNKLVPDEMLYGAGTVCSVITFKPGESIGVHGHTDNFEIYYILEGEAEVMDNNEVRTLHVGDSEICANGGIHSIKNNTDKQMKALALIFNNFENK